MAQLIKKPGRVVTSCICGNEYRVPAVDPAKDAARLNRLRLPCALCGLRTDSVVEDEGGAAIEAACERTRKDAWEECLQLILRMAASTNDLEMLKGDLAAAVRAARRERAN